jgi:hypothetical protein
VSRLLWSLITGFWCPDTRRPEWADRVTRRSSAERLQILLRPGGVKAREPRAGLITDRDVESGPPSDWVLSLIRRDHAG